MNLKKLFSKNSIKKEILNFFTYRNLLKLLKNNIKLRKEFFIDNSQIDKIFSYHKEIEIYDPEQNVEVCVLRHNSSPRIELLAPHDDKSPINNILKKLGATPYHICYEVDNIEECIVSLKREKFLPILFRYN